MSFDDLMAKATFDTFRVLGESSQYSERVLPDDLTPIILKPAVSELGEFGQVVGRQDHIKFLLADVPQADVGQSFTIVKTGRVCELVSLVYTDGYYAEWVIRG